MIVGFLPHLLRLYFHDCFVNGCDASLLLDDTSSFKGENNAAPSKNLARGFEVIDTIKSKVKEACPSTVSCTDIITFVSRAAVYFRRPIYWPVPLGHRDGTTASEDAANEQLPSPFEPLENITAKFTAKGLEMVLLKVCPNLEFFFVIAFKLRNLKTSHVITIL
ncbi:hypothetical protein TB2_026828 [Malus domestica]